MFLLPGVTSAGKSEQDYSRVTYDLTIAAAQTLAKLNPTMTFIYVSGTGTDSTERGRMMWARVKGRTENALSRVGFARVVNFRPGMMKPFPGQKNVPGLYRAILALYPIVNWLAPNSVCTIQQVGLAMIHAATGGSAKTVLEVPEIKALAVS